MKRVIVTGATSMIGVALIKRCLDAGCQVLAVVRPGSGRMNRLPNSTNLSVYECSLDNLSDLEHLTEKYDVFYHLAWEYTSKNGRYNPILQEKNILHTLNAVKVAKSLGCKKFFGAGSQAEYGKVDGIIGPNTVATPTSAYGISKYAAGQLSKILCNEYDMIHIWGRIFSVYGKHDNDATMLTYAIDSFLKDEDAFFSSGEQMWDYLFEDDTGEYLYRLGEYVKEDGVFCIANGCSRPLKDYIFDVGSIMNKTHLIHLASTGDGGPSYGLVSDTSALEQATLYKPRVSFSEGIKVIIDYKTKEKGE